MQRPITLLPLGSFVRWAFQAGCGIDATVHRVPALAKRCDTAIFGKAFASCFCAVAGPRKRGSALGSSWYNSRGRKRPRADLMPALLISCGIFGFGKK
jgi:hypothetical protein